MHINTLISIGSACRTRYQIDQYMKKINQNYHPDSYYFDWLMMGGVSGVANVISRGFEINPQMIELHSVKGKYIPRDIHSKHTFMHDFGKGWWESDYALAAERLNTNMSETMEKLKYLGRKTDSLLRNSNSVALIYNGTVPDSDWETLQRTLHDRYKKHFTLINILDHGNPPTNVEGIYTAFTDDSNSPKRGTPNEWQGWEESWFEALSGLNIINYKNKGFFSNFINTFRRK